MHLKKCLIKRIDVFFLNKYLNKKIKFTIIFMLKVELLLRCLDCVFQFFVFLKQNFQFSICSIKKKVFSPCTLICSALHFTESQIEPPKRHANLKSDAKCVWVKIPASPKNAIFAVNFAFLRLKKLISVIQAREVTLIKCHTTENS